MGLLEIIKAFILGIVQGITEWLPVSSTGHLILVEDFLKFNLSEAFVNTFFVVVQLGSIMAVIVLFFKELNPFSRSKNSEEKKDTIKLWSKIIVATLPAIVIGLLFSEKIDELFYNPITVSLMLIIYGIIFIVVERQGRTPKISNISNISYKLALGIGLFQILALIPGTSRSGATIIGAVMLGTSRFIASEFSFFLAIPVMLGASTLKLFKLGFDLTNLEWAVMLVGAFTAFIVSLYAIKFLMDYIKKHDFKVFGYYRIILGAIILIMAGIKLFA